MDKTSDQEHGWVHGNDNTITYKLLATPINGE